MQPGAPTARDEGDPDFRVTRLDATTWRIRPLTDDALAFVTSGIATDSDGEGVLLTDHQATNAFVHLIRTHGYATEYVGPMGPIRL